MDQLAVIVVIAHKVTLSHNEKASLRQCYKVLGKYPIKLICPEGLDVSVYKAINPNADFVFIDPKWQSSYLMFNELKRDKLLYEMFCNYKYMLYYELDAWVFTDQLKFWCGKGYDYVGAPWFEGWHEAKDTSKIIGVGNGGFSLRNIQKALTILRRIKKIRSYRKFWYKSKFQAVVRFENLLKHFPTVHSKNKLTHLPRNLWEVNGVNEDIFWARNVPAIFNDFNVADSENAIKFSFEVNPSFLFKKNNCKLPFGCHAWEKYEPEFWQKYILEQKNK